MSLSLFSPTDTAVLLIDFQDGTMGWVRSTDFEEMKKNALALAKAAKALDMPLILTTSLEDQAQGPVLSELREIAPTEFENRSQRHGVINALDDPDFLAAVKNAGRPNLIVAGVTNDVCTVYPTLAALDLGYNVQVVADAGGSMTKAGDDISLRRMEMAGAGITSANMMLTELAGNWTSDDGQKLGPIVRELIPAPKHGT